MARRNVEIAFSSDSFLDVVANLVGILIILIVLAGMRVSRAPVVLAKSIQPAQPIAAAIAPALPAPVLRTVPEPSIASAPTFVPATTPVVEEPVPTFPPLPVPAVAPKLAQEASQLQADLEQLRQREAQDRQEFQRLQRVRRDLEGTLATSNTTMQQQQIALAAQATQLAASEQQLKALQGAVSEAQQVLGRIVAQPAPVKELEHQLTPVGRLVTGKESHFLLIKNRIAPVPVEQLAENLQAEIGRRKEMMLNRQMFQGTVGPLQGFTMDYVLQRDSLSLAEELKYGRGIIRMSVTGWIIHPEADLELESATEALDPHSNFQRALRLTGPSSSLTFWVYPDSFEVHRQLKQYAHETGFWVASRPLPEGVPISGSPQGARSLAQ